MEVHIRLLSSAGSTCGLFCPFESFILVLYDMEGRMG